MNEAIVSVSTEGAIRSDGPNQNSQASDWFSQQKLPPSLTSSVGEPTWDCFLLPSNSPGSKRGPAVGSSVAKTARSSLRGKCTGNYHPKNADIKYTVLHNQAEKEHSTAVSLSFPKMQGALPSETHVEMIG